MIVWNLYIEIGPYKLNLKYNSMKDLIINVDISVGRTSGSGAGKAGGSISGLIGSDEIV